MKWIKKGLIFAPNTGIWWQQLYSILPTPIYLEESNIIRIYFSTTCKERFGRLTFIDVNADDPSQIIAIPDILSLDIGDLGSFDDCGVIPSAILKISNSYHLYYAGFQRHFRTPYSILSGLAISSDGKQFKRYSRTPILERTEDELSLRSAPTVIFENDIYRMIYVSDFGWKVFQTEIFENKMLPTYCLKYGESSDGINWKVKDEPVLMPEGDEFGFGRPFVVKNESEYKLYYSIRRGNISYRIGYAVSKDLIHWERKDNEVGIDVSDVGWDSEMVCYPAVISVKGKTYLFYNGNNNGESGFGYAELEDKVKIDGSNKV